MATYAEIRDALKTLIHAKITGASDLSQFYNRTLSSLSINASTSLVELTGLLEKYESLATKEIGGGEVQTHVIF
ncbi:hypothetical protein C4588_07245 [Candidatus Parcubacteria bacterium]|nr:MAG: hypothetical protein C4588_07245 [Candidatus Parcubacteria bacterium]